MQALMLTFSWSHTVFSLTRVYHVQALYVVASTDMIMNTKSLVNLAFIESAMVKT